MYGLKSQKTRNPGRILALAGAIALISGPALAAEPATFVVFSIARKPIGDTLSEIARQSGVQVSFDEALVHGKGAPPIIGRFNVEQALSLALSGAELVAVLQANGEFRIAKQIAAGADQQPQQVVIQAQRQSLGYAADSSRTASRSDTSVLDLAKSVSSVPRELIADTQAATITDALQGVSGISMEAIAIGPSSNIDVRGFAVEQAMTDGMMTGTSYTFSTPTIGIEKLEVIKGPESIIGGSAAKFGGVVNMVLKTPQADQSREISYTLDTSGKAQVGIDMTGSLSTDRKLRGRIVASSQYDGTPYRGWDAGRSNYLAPSLAWKDSVSSLVLATQIQRIVQPISAGVQYTTGNDVSSEGAYETAHAKDDASDIQVRRASFDYTRNVGDDTKLGLRGQYERTKVATNYWFEGATSLPIGTNPLYLIASNYRQSSVTKTIQADINHRHEWAGIEHRATLGFDYVESLKEQAVAYRYDGDSVVSVVPPGQSELLPSVSSLENTYQIAAATVHRKDLEKGLFLQDQMALGDHWRASATARYLSLRNEYGASHPSISKFLPAVGLMYQFAGDSSIYGSFSKGVQQNVNGTTSTGQSLPPVEGRQGEVGVKNTFFDDRLIMTTALFNIQKTNLAEADLDNSGFYHLIKGQRTHGIEFEVNGRLTPKINISGAYTYSLIDADPDSAVLQSKHILKAWVNYRIGAAGPFGWNLGLGALARSAEILEYNTDAVSYRGKNSGAVRLDGVLGYDSTGWWAKLGMRNLTGRRFYQAGSTVQAQVLEQRGLVTLTGGIKF